MPAPKPGTKKDSTNEVPMHDLGEIVAFITAIHEKGLETAPMPEVAKGCGYKHPTSTPFYRRVTAGRLFGLLSKTGAELTPRARDYLKPDSHGAKVRALADAINSVTVYAELLLKFSGKKLNSDLIANGLARSLNLTDTCAAACGIAFEASLKFGGLLSADGTVSVVPNAPVITFTKQPASSVKVEEEHEEVDDNSSETQKHTVYLDKAKKRKFIASAPMDITSAELKRVSLFLEYALILDQPNSPEKEEANI